MERLREIHYEIKKEEKKIQEALVHNRKALGAVEAMVIKMELAVNIAESIAKNASTPGFLPEPFPQDNKSISLEELL
jgi:hypothetical protein